MLETLEKLDTDLFLAINSWNSPFFDELFYIVTQGGTWISVYVLLFAALYLVYDFKTALIQVGLVGAVVILADFVSVALFKDMFQRYRPSHNIFLADEIHLFRFYKGGLYGFVSSHAVNFMVWSTMTFWLFYKQCGSKWLFLFFLAPLLAGYSRIYLGVHYPGDVFVGLLLGLTMALLGIFVYKRLNRRFNIEPL